MDWFLFDNGVRHERVKTYLSGKVISNEKNTLVIYIIITQGIKIAEEFNPFLSKVVKNLKSPENNEI